MDTTFYVVETEDDIFLGLIEFIEGGILIKTGFQGQPRRVPADEIVQMYPAHMHPAVVSDYIQAV